MPHQRSRMYSPAKAPGRMASGSRGRSRLPSWPRIQMSPAAPPYSRPHRSPSLTLPRRPVWRWAASRAACCSGVRDPAGTNQFFVMSSGMMPTTFCTTQLSRYRLFISA